MKKREHVVAAGIVSIAVSLLAGVAWGRSFSLDLRDAGRVIGGKTVLANHGVPAEVRESDGLLRAFDLDAGVADVGKIAVGDELTFTLFDDVTITLTLKVKAPSPLGGDVFLAEASNYGGVKNAVVMRTADGLTIDVQDYRNGKLYKVISTAAGVSVRELDASKTGKCGCESAGFSSDGDDALVSPRMSTPSTINGAPVSRSGEVAYVDVLVAYDANAKAWAEANGGGMLAFAQMAVQKMNTVLYNNELYTDYFRFRLVGVVDVSVSTTSLGTALEYACNGTGGWAPIKAKRDEVGADIVTVLIDNGSAFGTTGLGVSLTKDDYYANSFSESPYNACLIRSVAQSHTMTHEVGHNMGCGHAKEQITDPGKGLFSYSAGYYYYHADNYYHTIMAYGGEGPDGDAIQAPYFSDKYTYYDAETDSYFTPGDEQHDNYDTLYLTYEMASNWRAAKGIDLESGYAGELKWLRTGDDPINKAKAEGKKVFIVCGRDTCGYTQGTREACTMPTVKRILDQNFICWYAVYDDEWSTISKYYKGYSYGSTFPFKAVVDPVSGSTLKVQGGPPTTGYYLEDYAAQLVNLLGDVPGVKYNLTRNPNGGTYKGSSAEAVAINGLTYGGAEWWDVGVATRAGYTFAGWFTAPSGGEMVYGADGKCVEGAYWSSRRYIHAGGLTVYAQWKEARYTLTINPNGGTYKGKTTATVIANALAYGSTDYNSIGVPTRAGRKFLGWSLEASGGFMVYNEYGVYRGGSSFWYGEGYYNLKADLTVYAQWEETLADAADCPSLTFTTGGDASWYLYYLKTHKGSSSVKSGTIDHSQSTWMQTTVSGAGTISFWWYVSSEENYDGLRFYVDGEMIFTFSGTDKDWTKKSYMITSVGTHAIEWEYVKDGSVTYGDDCGLIDEVVWTPVSAQIVTDKSGSAAVVDADDAEPSLAEQAVGTFDGVVFGEQGVAGTVALTVAADGAISGKMLKDGLVQTLSADEVAFAIDESASFRRVVATGDGWIAWQNLWKAEPLATVAKSFAEAPVLVTPDGVSLKFSSTGVVTAKCGANSCSSVLIPVASPSTLNSQSAFAEATADKLSTLNYQLYLYFPPKAGVFEGYVAEIPLVWDGAGFKLLE